MNPEEKEIAYIAGALNAMASEYIQNMHRMIVWAERIRKLGYAVFIPGIDFLTGLVLGDWDYGIAFDNSQAFLVVARIMFVVPGWKNSKGTARELITAQKYDIPVYYEEEGYQELIRLRNEKT